jgi:threonyl-tRNA synthetase
MAVMIEHFAGKFPLWLAPVQIEIINVADRHQNYCDKIYDKLFDAGFRIEKNYDSMTVSNKIRLSFEKNKPNYMIIIGDDDIKNNIISFRDRANKTQSMEIDKFLEMIINERDNREIKN